MLLELLRLANESSLFQEIRLAFTLNDGIQSAPITFLQSIERNTKLARLSMHLNAEQSAEDVQSLVTLLKVSKTLTLLDLKCHGLNIQDFSEGFAGNAILKSLSLTSFPVNDLPVISDAYINALLNNETPPLNEDSRATSASSSSNVMMSELSRYPAMRLQKLTLSGKCDGELSSALESLLLSHPSLKMITVYCDRPPRGESNPFGSFFRRLSGLSAKLAADDHITHTSQVQQQSQSQSQALDQHLIENGPFITIRVANHRIFRPKSDLAVVKLALLQYPKLRLTNASLAGDIGFENLMNYCGRYLIKDSNVPLGLWPIALDRAACLESHKRQRSSVIYELLHGGVFAARETYASI